MKLVERAARSRHRTLLGRGVLLGALAACLAAPLQGQEAGPGSGPVLRAPAFPVGRMDARLVVGAEPVAGPREVGTLAAPRSRWVLPLAGAAAGAVIGYVYGSTRQPGPGEGYVLGIPVEPAVRFGVVGAVVGGIAGWITDRALRNPEPGDRG